MGKSKAKKPDERNIGKELRQEFDARKALLPEQFALDQQWAPQYTDLNTSLLGQALRGQMGLAGEVAPQMITLNEQLQQQEIAGSPLLRGFQDAALQDLRMGGDLSEEERIAANEASASGFAGTGMLGSNRSLLDRVLMRGDLSNARRQQRLGNAQSLYGTLQGGATTGTGLLGSLVGSAPSMVQKPNVEVGSAYAGNLNQQNQQEAWNAYNASQNRRAGLLGGLISGGASLLTGGLAGGLFGGGSKVGNVTGSGSINMGGGKFYNPLG
jgi:hypothetical protein